MRRKPSSACGGAEVRGPLSSSRHRRGLGGQAAGDQGEAARRGVGLDRLRLQAGVAELLLEQPREIGPRLVLHPRGDFLGEEFEQEIRHRFRHSSESWNLLFLSRLGAKAARFQLSLE